MIKKLWAAAAPYGFGIFLCILAGGVWINPFETVWGQAAVHLVLVMGILFGSTVLWNYGKSIRRLGTVENSLRSLMAERKGEEISLASSSNEEIETYLKQVLENQSTEAAYELLQKQAQLNAMQNQIHPHFLYNALDSIRGLSMEEGADKTADMVEALSRLFRYSISQGNNMQSLRLELENIDNYMKIQQYRFNNRYTIIKDFDISDDRIMNFKLPKLTLQPIIENAIFHGFDGQEEEANIFIRVLHTQSRLLISIEDNGVGMEEATLLKLNEKLSSGTFEQIEDNMVRRKSGIALVNVNARIKLLFGGEYGLVAYSSRGLGTEIQINLPLFDRER